MPLNLSERRSWVSQSEIRNMTIECNKRNGVNLAQGICDLPVPEIVRQGARQAVEDGFNIYTRYDGLPSLRRAVAAHYKKAYRLEVDPETEVICASGATGAFHCACLALLNPGDEVIVFEPYYGYHVKTLIAAGCVPVFVKMAPPDWTFTPADLERAATGRTRGLMVNTPANPTGKVFTRAELEVVAAFARSRDLFVFTDEIYEHFVYDGRVHVPPGCLPGMRQRTITISGCSKSFSITGWRVGYVVCDAAWATTIGYFNDLYYVCTPAPLQLGAAAGLDRLGDDYYHDLCRTYRHKRDALCQALAAAGLSPFIPQGAYYVLADMTPVPGKNSREKAYHFLDRTGVAAVPGRAFYHDGAGEDLARFCFARVDQVIDEACRRIENYRP